MPFRAKTLPPTVQCISYIEAYPYPAFVLNKRVDGKQAASLMPIFSNQPFRDLAFGPGANDPKSTLSGGLLEMIPGTGFEGIEEARKLGLWVELLDDWGTFLLNATPVWQRAGQPPVPLELVKTSVALFWIITSVPRGGLPIPRYQSITIHSEPSNLLKTIRDQASGHATPSTVVEPRASESQDIEEPPPNDLDRPPSPGSKPVIKPEVDSSVKWLMSSSKMPDYMLRFPWEKHPLGPTEKWPQSLKTMVSVVMFSPYPWALWWGQELVLIYNEAYATMSAAKHPGLFGQSGKIAWGEIWEVLGPKSDIVWKEERAVSQEDDRLFFARLTEKMLPEEVYHSWAWIPVRNEEGQIGGFLNADFETTSKVLYQRRIQLLRHMIDKTVVARSKVEFAEAVRAVLASFAEIDVPFAACYFNTVDAPPASSAPTSKRATLRVTSRIAFKIGIPDDHPAMPDKQIQVLDPVTLRPPMSAYNSNSTSALSSTVRTESSSHGSEFDAVTLSDSDYVPQWPLFDVYSAKKPIHVEQLPLSTSEMEFGHRPGGWNDLPREAVVVPIAAEGDDVCPAVLILGLNTRRPYDKEYRTFMELLHMTLSSSLTAALGREAEVKKAEQLAQLDAAKTSFFSSASHELRTPLTLIAGPVNDAARISTEPKVKKLLNLSVRNVARLSRLVESLMDFSRVEAGRLLGRFQATNIVDFTLHLTSLFRNPIEQQGLEYRVVVDRKDQATVYLDHDLWEKIVFNVIGNAFKYTLAGHVEVRVQYRPPHAEFIVSDTGVGIPPEETEKIFDRFHRVEGVARSHEGTGIGLALTRELVKVHGGFITVESTLPQPNNPEAPHGTTFTVHIPLGTDHLSSAYIEEESKQFSATRTYGRGIVEEASSWGLRSRTFTEEGAVSEGTGSESAQNSDSTPRSAGELQSLFRFARDDCILIVDDNFDIRKFIRTIFQSYCKVIEAENAYEGLQMMEERSPNLVLSDVMMPGMDGIAFVGVARSRPSIAWTPMILLTARAGDEARTEGLLSGADDYVCKPFKSQELIGRVHLQMQIGKRRHEMLKLFEHRTKEIKILSDMSPVGIFRTDSDGQVTYTNKRWHELTDHPADRSLNEWIDSVAPEFQQAVHTLVSRVSLIEERSDLEIRWRNDRWTKLELERVANRGLIGAVTDTSVSHMYEAARLAQASEREAAAQLRAADAERQRAEADERRRAQELLVDVTSHELRQPVSAILNCSQLVRANLSRLLDDLKKSNEIPFKAPKALLTSMEDDLEALDSIYQCGLSQERIANDVLSLSRLQLDTLSIQNVEFRLTEEFTRIISIFSNELRMKRIKLDISIADSVEILEVGKVTSDRTRFAQIVTNLMSNAIKFTDLSPAHRRQIAVHLDLSLEPPNGNSCVPPPLEYTDLASLKAQVQGPDGVIYVYVSVKDSGPGLKPGDLSLLFQRFQQGSNSHEVFGGSGLGLFVSRKLCELMGGNINVDSTYGEGATFRFYVKMHPSHARVESTAVSRPQRTSPESANAEADPSPAAQTAYHILITEDNIINQTVLNRQLKQFGFTTELASNGKEALDRIRRLSNGSKYEGGATLPRRFDAILMDCEMPVMNGHVATREIRRMESEGIMPLRNRIIALTGNARSGQVEAALSSGMDDVMIKPYKIDELVQKIRERVMMD